MSDLKFTLRDCDDVIRQCLQNNNIRTKDFEILPRHVNNYIFKIRLQNGEILFLYAKPKSEAPRSDKILYEDFKNVLEEFNPNLISPKFYCGKSELLFFEDLTHPKFQTNQQFFDLKHVQEVLKVLANFHATGFAYEEKISKKLKEEYSLNECNFDIDEVEDLLWSVIDNKERVQEVAAKLEERQKSSKYVKILCHSNLTRGNILFYYVNGIPKGCRLINFNSKLYASPVYDVLQVIFFNMNEDFRKKFYHELLCNYYEDLEKELEKYGLRIAVILPIDDFKLSCDDLLPLIKLEAMKLKKSDEIQDIIEELKEALMFSKVSREDCFAIINKIIKSFDYNLLSFSITPWKKAEESLLKIKIRYSLENKILNCLVRSKSQNTKERFKKEVFIYDTLFRKFEDLSIDFFKTCTPSCYFQKPEDLIFEDLSEDFISPEAHFDVTLLSVIIKKLVKFHACSLIFEEKMSERSKTVYRITNDYKQYLDEAYLNDSELLLLNKILDFFPDFKTKYMKRIFPNEPSDHFRNVVCHGNLLPKNILVQYEDRKAIDCRFVDFQNIKYCPPAYDFLSLLYSTPHRLTLFQYEEKMKKIYYEELENIIVSCNYAMEKFFSFEEFVDVVENYRPLVMVRVLIDLAEESNILTNDEDRTEEQISKNLAAEDKLKEYIVEFCEMCSALTDA